MKRLKQIDWVGKWYVFIKERGGNDLVSFAKANLKTNEAKWFEYSHSQMDGAGAFVKTLRDLGYAINEVPKGRSQEPSIFKRPRILFDALRDSKLKKINWKEKNLNTKNPPNTGYPWIGFSKEETLKILEFTKKKKLSLNSYIMGIYTKLLLPKLIDGSFEGKWMFPVNMRGPVEREDELSNASSCVMIDVTNNTTSQDIHKQIKDKLSRNQHWGIWWLANIGKVVRTPIMRYLSKNSSQKSFYLGTISNMGAWAPENSMRDEEHDEEVWIANPPGSPNYPISTALFIWHGKLGFGLKIHPYILSDQSKTKHYLDEIKQQIISNIS